MLQRNMAIYLIHLGHSDLYFGGMKMDIKNTYTGYGNQTKKEEFTVRLTDPMLYDRLRTLSAEYSLSVELLVNIAVKRLVSDIDFVRDLRTGKVGLE